MDTAPAPVQPTLRMIPVAQIVADAHQPRKHYDAEALTDLAASIAEHGVLQPILVRPMVVNGKPREWLNPDEDPTDDATWSDAAFVVRDPVMVIIAGERRWRASQQAGLVEIPAIVAEHLSDDEIAVIQLIENLQRADLSTRETVVACANLVERLGLGVASEKLGKSKAWVSRRSGIMELPNEIQKLMADGLVDSIDVLHDLAALFWLKRDSFERFQRAYLDPELETPTREEVRDTLDWARRTAKYEEERAARQKAEEDDRQQTLGGLDHDDDQGADKRADNPRPVSAPSTSAASAAAAEQARRDAESEARRKADEYTEALERRIYAAFGIPAPSSEEHPEDYALTMYIAERVPAKPPAGQMFYLEFQGEPAKIADAAEIVFNGAQGRLTADVSAAEALQIEKLLGRPVRFNTECELHGALIEQRLKAHEARNKPKATKKKQAAKTPPQAGADAKSVVAAFLKACTKRDAKAKTRAADLHAAYLTWCGCRGDHTPMTINDSRWSDALAKAGLKKHRVKTGFQYQGIALLPAKA